MRRTATHCQVAQSGGWKPGLIPLPAPLAFPSGLRVRILVNQPLAGGERVLIQSEIFRAVLRRAPLCRPRWNLAPIANEPSPPSRKTAPMLAKSKPVGSALAVLSLCALSSPSTAATADSEDLPQDRIVLANKGRVQEGRIVLVDQERLIMRDKRRLLEFDREEVLSYAWMEDVHRRWQPRLEQARFDPGAKLGELALELDSVGLAREADAARWLAIFRKGQSAELHEGLGHRRHGDSWRVPHGRRWIPLENLSSDTSRWSQAWETCSLHFDVRSNLPPEATLRAMLDAEEVYRLFYSSFAAPFGLMQASKRLQLHLHGDGSSFPKDGLLLHVVDDSKLRVSLDLERGYTPSRLVIPLTQLLLQASAETQGDRPELPIWLARGLARRFSAQLGIQGEQSERILFDAERGNDWDREFHAKAERPLEFQRLLTLSIGDFDGPKSALTYAQCATLVDFCWQGEDGRWREGFVEYVRQAVAGQGTATRFKKLLKLRDKKFQEAYAAFVAGA